MIESSAAETTRFVERGFEEFRRGNREAAVSRFSEAIRLDVRNAKAFRLRGVVLSSLGRKEEALIDYSEAIGLDPNSVEAFVNRGIVLFSFGRKEEALADHSTAIELDPNFAAAFYNRGCVLADLGRKEEALVDYSTAIELEPDCAKTFLRRGCVLLCLGQKEKALSDFSRAIELDPYSAESFGLRADVLGDLGKKEEALNDYSRAIELDPDYAVAFCNRGLLFRSLGRKEEALLDYSLALVRNPNDAMAFRNRGCVLLVGREKEALADYSQAIELDSNCARAFLNRGAVLSSLGRMAEALVDYSKAIELDPTYVVAVRNRARALRRLGRLEEALVDYSRAIALDKNYRKTFLHRGRALSSLCRNEEALQDYSKAIELDPTCADAYCNRASALRRLGQNERALIDYSKAIDDLDCNSGNAFRQRGNVYSSLGRKEEASLDFVAGRLPSEALMGLQRKSFRGIRIEAMCFQRELVKIGERSFRPLFLRKEEASCSRGEMLVALSFFLSVKQLREEIRTLSHYPASVVDYSLAFHERKKSLEIASFQQEKESFMKGLVCPMSLLRVDPVRHPDGLNRLQSSLLEWSLVGSDIQVVRNIGILLAYSSNASVVYRFHRARVYRKLLRYHDAVDDLSIAIHVRDSQTKQDRARLHHERGNVFVDLEEWDRAESDFRVASKLDPAHREAVAALSSLQTRRVPVYFVPQSQDLRLTRRDFFQRNLVRHLRYSELLEPTEIEIVERPANDLGQCWFTFLIEWQRARVLVGKHRFEVVQRRFLKKTIVEYSASVVPPFHVIPRGDVTIDDSKILGRGSFGVVRRGVLVRAGVRIPIAVKREMIRPDVKREVRLMSQMDFPQIAKCYGCWRTDDVLSVAMELCGGGEILKWLKGREIEEEDKRSLSSLKFSCTMQLAVGIQYLHNQGIVHRDLKPANILISEGVVKIVDFGLSSHLGTVSTLITKGTPCYIPNPDYPVRDKSQAPKIDTYAFGIICWELWTGNRAFWGPKEMGLDALSLVRRIHSSMLRPNSAKITNRRLRGLIVRCWSDHSRDRPFFDEIVRELEAIRDEFGY